MSRSDFRDSRLTKFEIDIDLFSSEQRKEIDPLALMETLLVETSPNVFLHSGKATKLLDLALQYYADYLSNDNSSLSERAAKLGWKKESKGAVSNYARKLEDLGLIDHGRRKFNEKFLLKLYGEIATKIKFFERLLECSKDLIHFKGPLNEIIVEEPFRFSNSGELIIGMTKLFNNVTEGEEVYLILKQGRTWGSDDVGEILRSMLKKLVEEKNVKLRVLTSPLMKPELQSFFDSIGDVVVDETFINLTNRWLYAAGFAVEVLKVKGINESPDCLGGMIKRDLLDEKTQVAKSMFEKLQATQNRTS